MASVYDDMRDASQEIQNSLGVIDQKLDEIDSIQERLEGVISDLEHVTNSESLEEERGNVEDALETLRIVITDLY